MKKQSLFIFIIFISLFAFGARNVSAANLTLQAPASVKAGENLDTVAKIDTGGVMINSIELVVSYDTNLLSFTGYSDENSIVKVWIDPPHAEQGEIYLSGIIPGGVSGLYDANKKDLSPIPLVHLIFKAQKEGNTDLSFASSKILENDGVGTPLPHDNLNANITIQNNPNYTPESQKSVINKAPNSNIQTSPIPPFFLIWIVIILLLSSFLVYKLLKYKV